MRTRTLRQLERASYKVTRGLGDAASYQSGGVGGLLKRRVRRVVRRSIFRSLGL